jgi:hypothetical protein
LFTIEFNGEPGHVCRAHHVHALAHGDLPDEIALSLHAQRVGFGRIVQNEAVKDAESAAFYMLKSLSKCNAIDRPHRLWVNGGTLEHSSRGYWRVDGQQVAGRDGAIRAFRDVSVAK